MKKKKQLSPMAKSVLMLSGSEFLLLGIGFIRSTLLVRLCSAIIFGQYQYAMSFVALMASFHQFIDRVPERFFPTDKENQSKIYWGYLYTKLAIFLFTSLILFGLINFSIIKIENQRFLYPLVFSLLGLELMNIFKVILMYILKAHERYATMNLLRLITQVMGLIIVIIFSVYPMDDLFENLNVILSYQVLFEFMGVSTLALVIYRNNLFKLFSYPQCGIKEILTDGVFQYKKYFLPIIGTSISGFIKIQLPNIILGSFHSFESVTYYDIAKKIYTILNRVIPSAMRSVLPSVLKRIQQPGFEKVWLKYTMGYQVLIIIASLMIFYFREVILLVFKLPTMPFITDLFYYYSVAVVLSVWVHCIQYIILTTNNTAYVFYSSTFKQIIWVIAIVLFHSQLGPVEFSAINMVSVVAGLSIFLVWIARAKKNLMIHQIAHLMACLIFTLIIYFTKDFFVEIHFLTKILN